MPGHPISRPLFEHPLLVGCEREPLVAVVCAGVMFGMLGWVLHSVVAGVTCIILLVGVIPVLRRLAKINPNMFRVYAANLRYRAYYPPRSPMDDR